MATDIFERERLLNAPTRNFLAVTGVLSLAIVAGSLLPAGNALHVPGYMVTLLGKYLTYALLALSVDLVWGFMGVLSLGHGAFFALGGYGFGMYLMRQIGARGVYGNANLPDFMVFLNWKELPCSGTAANILSWPCCWWFCCPVCWPMFSAGWPLARGFPAYIFPS